MHRDIPTNKRTNPLNNHHLHLFQQVPLIYLAKPTMPRVKITTQKHLNPSMYESFTNKEMEEVPHNTQMLTMSENIHQSIELFGMPPPDEK